MRPVFLQVSNSDGEIVSEHASRVGV
jgi:hypothetical protein